MIPLRKKIVDNKRWPRKFFLELILVLCRWDKNNNDSISPKYNFFLIIQTKI